MTASQDAIIEGKMEFLKKVKEEKEILFGPFSDTLKKEDKTNKWKELSGLAKAYCLIPMHKDWTYTRDTFWQNLKKSVMAKLDFGKKPGIRKTKHLTEMDFMILDILGDSTVICASASEEEYCDDQPLLVCKSTTSNENATNVKYTMFSKRVMIERKMQFLEKVREEKEILFGTDKSIKQDKIDKWKELADLAKANYLIPAHKDWTYVRDTLWPNLKKTVMSKIDNAKKSGTARIVNVTELDNLVLDIVGIESPVKESFDEYISVEEIGDDQEEFVDQKLLPTSTPNENSRKRKMPDNINVSEIHELKKQKLELEVEYLKLQNYKIKLEILQIERALELPTSECTTSVTLINQDEI